MAGRVVPAESLLSSLPLLNGLARDSIMRLGSAAQRRPLARGEHVFRHGSPPAGMYAVVHGQIKLIAPRGAHRRLVALLGPGSTFGEPVMFLGRPALVDAIAASDALVLLLPKDAVLHEVEHNAAFARRVIDALSERAESLVLEGERQARAGGRARLAEYLLQRCDTREGECAFELPATKASLAAQLHLTPGHFSRLLRELAAAGVVRVARRRFTVTDAARLAQLTGAAAASPDGRTRVRSDRARLQA
jgi:CRP/FNR family transcriptional regulator, dissimilatory nitrate respiration regulator